MTVILHLALMFTMLGSSSKTKMDGAFLFDQCQKQRSSATISDVMESMSAASFCAGFIDAMFQGVKHGSGSECFPDVIDHEQKIAQDYVNWLLGHPKFRSAEATVALFAFAMDQNSACFAAADMK